LQTSFLSEKVKQQRKEDAQEDAGCQGKVEREVPPLDHDVAGKTPHEWQLAGKQDGGTDHQKNRADKEKQLT
jgi:hypothetical protein